MRSRSRPTIPLPRVGPPRSHRSSLPPQKKPLCPSQHASPPMLPIPRGTIYPIFIFYPPKLGLFLVCLFPPFSLVFFSVFLLVFLGFNLNFAAPVRQRAGTCIGSGRHEAPTEQGKLQICYQKKPPTRDGVLFRPPLRFSLRFPLPFSPQSPLTEEPDRSQTPNTRELTPQHHRSPAKTRL